MEDQPFGPRVARSLMLGPTPPGNGASDDIADGVAVRRGLLTADDFTATDTIEDLAILAAGETSS